MTRIVICGLLLVLTLGTGCLRYKSNPGHEPQPLPATLADVYDYRPLETFEVTEKVVAEKRKYRVFQVEFPVQEQGFQTNRILRFYYYRPRIDQPVPAIMILPVSGGSYDLEEYFARYFSKRGYACLIVHREKIKREEERVENINPLLHQTVVHNRLVMDWMETRPELDKNRIGVFGASMGGIKGALLAPVDSRVKAAVLGLAGGDLPHILVHSREPGVERRRKRLLDQDPMSLEALEAKLGELITHDPLHLAPYVNPEKVLLILARWDKVVPYAKGWELREAMGQPETSVVLGGHYSALIYIPYIQSRAYRFFRRHFREEAQ